MSSSNLLENTYLIICFILSKFWVHFQLIIFLDLVKFPSLFFLQQIWRKRTLTWTMLVR